MKELLQQGADVDARANFKHTPLELYDITPEAARLLLQWGANYSLFDKRIFCESQLDIVFSDKPHLSWTVHGYIDQLKRALSKDKNNIDHAETLMYAIGKRRIDIVKLLLPYLLERYDINGLHQAFNFIEILLARPHLTTEERQSYQTMKEHPALQIAEIFFATSSRLLQLPGDIQRTILPLALAVLGFNVLIKP